MESSEVTYQDQVPTRRPRRNPADVLWRFTKGIFPLILIGVAVYVVFNFPALWTRLTFMVSSPDSASAATLPEVIRTGALPGGGNGTGDGQGSVPCRGNIPYDSNGRPRAICDNYIYIPRIRVAAPIVRPASTSEAVINDALLRGVIKYPGTADPGERGNVFLTGHSSYYWWVDTDYRNVFALVPELRVGDEIVVYHRGKRYLYRTHRTFEVSPNQTDVLKPTRESMVTLSTCVPVGTSYRRIIIRARQVSPSQSSNVAPSGSAETPARLPGVR
ncbi:MAG: class E sortase [bacterium]|nr:class E sortase [bacterium]